MRLIARLDTKLEHVVKGRQLEGVKKQYLLTDVFELIKSNKISEEIGTNEFLLHDSVASLYKWNNFYLDNEVIPYSGRPLTISGGIRSIEVGKTLIKKCERISLNTYCFENLSILDDLTSLFGAQSVSVEIHALKYRNKYNLLSCNGKILIDLKFEDYLKKLSEHNFGEINLLSVSRDGMGNGIDLELFEKVKNFFPKKSIIIGGGLGSLVNIERYIKEGINGIFFSTLFHKKVKELLSE